jgi:tetratricopeptide (TPR) repeat protein
MARAVELEQITPDYHLNLGWMLEEMGQLEAARMAYAQAIARSPSLLGLDFWEEGQPAARQRERLIETAQVLSPSQAAYYLGNYAEAADRLETALRASPQDAARWLELGQVRLANDNPAQALEAARQALALGGPLGGVFALSARAHLALGELDAAAADLEVVRFIVPGYGAHMLSGQLAEARGDRAGAAAAYQAAVDAAPLTRAVNYGPWVWGRPPLAGDTLPFFQKPALAESLVQAYLALGDLYAQGGMVSEARAAYEAVLALNPNQLEARTGLEALP